MESANKKSALTWSGEKVLHFEVVRSFESEPEAFGLPLFLPQDVLAEAAGAGAHVGKVQQLWAVDQRLVVFS